MKYHPIDDPKWFRNRNYIGKNWNRKYIRAVQSILAATQGKVGKGKQFFMAAFGEDEFEFNEILNMPEALIIKRFEHDKEKREKFDFVQKYGNSADDLTGEWRALWRSLSPEQRKEGLLLIQSNDFSDMSQKTLCPKLRTLLGYYSKIMSKTH